LLFDQLSQPAACTAGNEESGEALGRSTPCGLPQKALHSLNGPRNSR
jgi:hypothetical protein